MYTHMNMRNLNTGHILILTVVLLCNVCSNYGIHKYDRRCPYRAEWNLQAEQFCGNVTQYYCLLDDYKNEFTEFCGDKPDFWTKGSKAIFRGNIDRELCVNENYQPFVFSTFGNSKCMFTKSLCSSKGQVVYRNGSSSEDRQCRCNHVNGYSFVMEQRNLSFCIPSLEDCSCFQKLCENSSFVLSSDYSCVRSLKEVPVFEERKTMVQISMINSINLKFHPKSTYKTDHSIFILTAVYVLVLISLVMTVGFIAVLILHSFFQPTFSTGIDCGKYKCHLSDGVEERIANKTIERPVIVFSQTSFTTQSQSEVTFNCNVSSDLKLTKLVWQKTSADTLSFIETSDCKKYSGGSTQCSSLTIKYAEPSDEGSYVCYATNDIGTTKSSAISLKLVETEQIMSVCSPYYTGKAADSSEEKFAQVALGKWEAEHARAKSKLLIDEEFRVVLIGKTGSGKSATGNMIAGCKIFESEMSGGSVTKTTECTRIILHDKEVLLIDTPGILQSESDEKSIELEIGKCVTFGAPGLHSILFVMPIGRITKEDITVINTFLGYFGRDRMEHHVIVVFTFGDLLQRENKTIQDYLQTVPEEVKCFLQRCRNRYVVFNNKLNQYKREPQVHCLFQSMTNHKFVKGLGYYTDILFQSAEKDLQKKEDEIQRHLEELYNKRVEEMTEELRKITEQIQSLHKSGDQAQATYELQRQLQELTIKSKQELDITKKELESKLSKVRDKVRQEVKVETVVSHLDNCKVLKTNNEPPL